MFLKIATYTFVVLCLLSGENDAEFVIKTDHKPLKYLLDAPLNNKQLQLWALSIAGYNCKIEYLPGTQNTCADLLSRHPNNVGRPTNDESEGESSVQLDVNENSFNIQVIDSSQFEPKMFAACDIPIDNQLRIPKCTLPVVDMSVEQLKDDEIVRIKSEISKTR